LTPTGPYNLPVMMDSIRSPVQAMTFTTSDVHPLASHLTVRVAKCGQQSTIRALQLHTNLWSGNRRSGREGQQ
jgi:hypothetical protein